MSAVAEAILFAFFHRRGLYIDHPRGSLVIVMSHMVLGWAVRNPCNSRNVQPFAEDRAKSGRP